jgi:hypothetical protein
VTERFGGCLNDGMKMEPLLVALGQLCAQLRVKGHSAQRFRKCYWSQPLEPSLLIED